jgi:hypothetical protein
MPRNFEVILRADPADPSSLIEDVSAVDGGPMTPAALRKLKKREMRMNYRAVMKDQTRFAQTHMADLGHKSVVMRRGANDDVTFFCFESFVITFARDPEVEEEFDTPMTPFVTAPGGGGGGGDPVFGVTASGPIAANPADKRFSAGPFRAHPNAEGQRFYKFSLQTTPSNLSLDPDIIIEL